MKLIVTPDGKVKVQGRSPEISIDLEVKLPDSKIVQALRKAIAPDGYERVVTRVETEYLADVIFRVMAEMVVNPRV